MRLWLLRLVPFVGVDFQVQAHPEKLTCNDPRARDGGKMMGGYVTLNQLTTDIVFTASASHYNFKEAVHFTIAANGSRYVTGVGGDAPHGVFLAVQVEFTGPNGEAMGAFHDLSPDLALTPNCASSVFSKTAGGAFNGTSSFSWTPSRHPFELGVLSTTGNATFKLLWANGPGGSDKLSSALGVPNTYLYMKMVTLAPHPSLADEHRIAKSRTSQPGEGRDAAAAAGAEGCAGGQCPYGCVLDAKQTAAVEGVAHAFKRSPVFVQQLKGGTQTFPAERCVRCRRGAACGSARVECPSEPGLPVVEKLWLESDSCAGPPNRVSKVADVVCPGPSHWHPNSLNLTRFVPKLRRDYPEEIPDDATAEMALVEYRRMLSLVQLDPMQPVVPSRLVDLAWHSHILDTAAYQRDSLRMFGHYLHHAPSFGGSEEQEDLVQQQDNMFERYLSAFGEQPGEAWDRTRRLGVSEFPPLPQDEVWKMQKSPDCCSARCVKLNCAGCVGCNAIDCGYMAAGDEASQRKKPEHALSPTQFEGYVPSSTASPLESPQDFTARYLCSASPHDKIKLSWSIVGHHIHFKLESKVEAWFGIGLADNASTGMGPGVDYMMALSGRNYTAVAVRDAYKWDAGNGWPCWDVNYECSPKNSTKGTKDTEDDVIVRNNGYTTATWNRKLATGDSKDWDVADRFTRVLFAYGVDDYFTYHEDSYGQCILNFFTGERQSCAWGSTRRLSSDYVV